MKKMSTVPISGAHTVRQKLIILKTLMGCCTPLNLNGKLEMSVFLHRF